MEKKNDGVVCPECNGSKGYMNHNTGADNMDADWEFCPLCNGSGRIADALLKFEAEESAKGEPK